MRLTRMKALIQFMQIIIILITFYLILTALGFGWNEKKEDYIQCGYTAFKCPDGYTQEFIGGQCMRCFIPKPMQPFQIDWEEICKLQMSTS